MRTAIWFLPLINTIVGYLLVLSKAPGYRMLILILLLFLGMKAVSLVYRYPGKGKLGFFQWIVFALGWPGMDPLPFEQLGKHKQISIERSYLRSGLLSLVAGLVLLYSLARLLHNQALPEYWLCLLSFIPFIMIFHIGIGNIGVSLWAVLGIAVTPLMDAPWKAEQLGTFWGKRWNIAFIQMTRITLFVPFARRQKGTWALLLSFLISGIFHEVALTLPVDGGYGLPLLYFTIQALLVLAERKFIHLWPPFARRLWTYTCLLIPFPLLLPPAFLSKMILPLLNVLTG